MIFILTRVIDIVIGFFTVKSVNVKMQIKILVALVLGAILLSGLSYGLLADFPRAILTFFWTSIGYQQQPLTSFSHSRESKFGFKYSGLSKIGCLQDEGSLGCETSSGPKPDSYFDTSISIRHKQRFSPSSDVKREAVAAMNIALDLQNRGRTDKALKVFQHALALDPSHADILTAFGEFLEWHVKDVVKADHMYQIALENSPQHGRAMLNRNRTAPIVEEIDQERFNRVDQKRTLLYKIPSNHPGLRRAKKEAYFAHIYHTNAIEGNTLSLAQTRSIVETRLAVGGKSLREQNEVLGLDSALSFINSTLVGRVGRLTLQDILDIHTRVLGYVDPTEAGRFRNNQVYVGEFTPPPASELPDQMDALVEWLNSPSSLALHPVEYAALAHYRLVTIHPFYDGNGRTSRLLMNLILMQAGFPPVSIEVSDRLAYYETLQQGNDGDIRPFIRFISRCAERTLDEYLAVTMEDYGNVIHTSMLQKGRFHQQERVIVVGADTDEDDDDHDGGAFDSAGLPTQAERSDDIRTSGRSRPFTDRNPGWGDQVLPQDETDGESVNKNYFPGSTVKDSRDLSSDGDADTLARDKGQDDFASRHSKTSQPVDELYPSGSDSIPEGRGGSMRTDDLQILENGYENDENL